MYVCINMCVFVPFPFLYTCIYTCVYVYTYIHVCMYIHAHTHEYVYTYIYIHIYIYTYTYTYTSMCMYIFTYTYIYTYTHITRTPISSINRQLCSHYSCCQPHCLDIREPGPPSEVDASIPGNIRCQHGEGLGVSSTRDLLLAAARIATAC